MKIIEPAKYIKRKGTVALFNKNCDHVVDVSGGGDIFCTICGWKSDPQNIVDFVMKNLSFKSGIIADSAKKVLGWD